ncbi:unnamed protein product [Alopecurus aequalis]
MAGWASLPSDLVRSVGDLLLATNDIDCYLDMRAACRSWRSATAKQHRAANLRLRPRRWVMLDEGDHNVDGRLFVNVSTGRFLRRRCIPLLRDHFLVTTSDGLLVLGDRNRPYYGTARVLNPLTGLSVSFAVEVPHGVSGPEFAAVGGSSEPTLVFFVDHGEECGDEVLCADPTSERFREQSLPGTVAPASVVAYAGDVYVACDNGAVYRGVGRVKRWHSEPIIAADTSPEAAKAWMWAACCCLVESDGELLLVRRSRGSSDVFKVDFERKALERVESIGGRALFLGDRCLSVNADKLPSVDGGSVYYTDGAQNIYRYDMKDGIEEEIPGFRARPFTLLQLLLAYCEDLPYGRECNDRSFVEPTKAVRPKMGDIDNDRCIVL